MVLTSHTAFLHLALRREAVNDQRLRLTVSRSKVDWKQLPHGGEGNACKATSSICLSRFVPVEAPSFHTELTSHRLHGASQCMELCTCHASSGSLSSCHDPYVQYSCTDPDRKVRWMRFSREDFVELENTNMENTTVP